MNCANTDEMTASHAQQVLDKFAKAAAAAGVPFEGYHDQVLVWTAPSSKPPNRVAAT